MYAEQFARPISIDNEVLKKTMESVRIHDDTRRRTLESASATYAEQFARPIGIDNDALRKAMESVRIQDDALRRSFDHSALLSRSIADTLSTMHALAPTTASYRDTFEPRAEFRAKPVVLQTNSQLSVLTSAVTQLVDVARQQAEFSQGISANAELALKFAIQSGEEAKASTLLARKSVRVAGIAIIVAFITTVASVAVNYKLSNSTDTRMKEEIRLLGDISGKLQRLSDRPVTPVTSGPFRSFRYYSVPDISVFPAEGSGGFGVEADVLHQFAGKVGH